MIEKIVHFVITLDGIDGDVDEDIRDFFFFKKENFRDNQKLPFLGDRFGKSEC